MAMRPDSTRAPDTQALAELARIRDIINDQQPPLAALCCALRILEAVPDDTQAVEWIAREARDIAEDLRRALAPDA